MIGRKMKKKELDDLEAKSPSQLALSRLLRNKAAVLSLCLIFLLVALSVSAPVITPYLRDTVDVLNRFKAPSAQHLLGTDDVGRDLFTRLIYAGRVSLMVGILSTVISTVIGVVVGALAGFYGGAVDMVLMRITDIFASMPFFIIAITIMSLFGTSIFGTILVMGCLWWTSTARLLRNDILSLREREFMEAATALGIPDRQKIWKQLLPNALPSVIVSATLNIANAILTESALSYLGLGVQVPVPSWGNMLSVAQNMYILANYWWIWVCPGVCIFVTVMSFNFLGDGLRDAFDPKQGG